MEFDFTFQLLNKNMQQHLPYELSVNLKTVKNHRNNFLAFNVFI